jgi:aminodeoxychorismate lyase
MIVFLNGQFVSEEQAVVSVFDRSFLYGDGLFESLRVVNGRPFRWTQHFERLRRGAEFLDIEVPFGSEELAAGACQLIERNHLPDAVMRLTLSRGVGRRGYSPKGAHQPTLVMSLHPAPELAAVQPPLWKLITASVRLPAGEPLAQFKTCNKLAQVLARAEADAGGADEALLVNTDGFAAEASSSNLFWIERETVCTPPLASGILAGVTRAVIMEVCQTLHIPTRESQPRPKDLLQADGLFLSLSTLGVVEARELDGHRLRRSPLAQRIHTGYERLLAVETV